MIDENVIDPADVPWDAFDKKDNSDFETLESDEFWDFDKNRVLAGVVIDTVKIKYKGKENVGFKVLTKDGLTHIVGQYATLESKFFDNGKLLYKGNLVRITRPEKKTKGSNSDYYDFKVEIGPHYKVG